MTVVSLTLLLLAQGGGGMHGVFGEVAFGECHKRATVQSIVGRLSFVAQRWIVTKLIMAAKNEQLFRHHALLARSVPVKCNVVCPPPPLN